MTYLAGACLFTALFSGCRNRASGEAKTGAAASPGSLLVAAAQSLQGKIEPAADVFRRIRPGVEVSWTFASAGALARQIEAGAPVDVFLSASDLEMNRLENKGRLLPGSRRVLARNEIVLIAAASIPSETLGRWTDLARPGARRIAIGDPETVPAGMYARDVFIHLGVLQAITPKLVLGANVRQVLDYVARGETDAGVVFASDVDAARGPVRLVAPAPTGSHRPVRYPMAVIRDSAHPDLARQFLDVLASPEVQALLQRGGFQPANEGAMGSASQAAEGTPAKEAELPLAAGS